MEFLKEFWFPLERSNQLIFKPFLCSVLDRALLFRLNNDATHAHAAPELSENTFMQVPTESLDGASHQTDTNDRHKNYCTPGEIVPLVESEQWAVAHVGIQPFCGLVRVCIFGNYYLFS